MLTTTVTTRWDTSQTLSFELNSHSSHVNDLDSLYKIYTLVFGKIKLIDVALKYNTPRLNYSYCFASGTLTTKITCHKNIYKT